MGSAGALPPAILPLRNSLVFLSSKLVWSEFKATLTRNGKTNYQTLTFLLVSALLNIEKTTKLRNFFCWKFPRNSQGTFSKKNKRNLLKMTPKKSLKLYFWSWIFKNLSGEKKAHYLLNLIYTMFYWVTTQSAFTCSKLTIEALEQGVKYVRSQQ